MIKHIDLHALVQTLIAAEQGSFHKAGLRLGVQPSTISRRVKTLERRVGVALFERHNHGVKPTQSGRDFLDSARRILGDLEGLVTNARNVGRGETGWLRVGLYLSLSKGPLRDALFAYMDRFPKVEVRIVDESRHSLIERLNSGAVDVAVLAGQVWNGSHELLPLWSERILLALPENHRLCEQSTVSWDDLRRERFVFGNRDPGPELRDFLVAKFNGTGVLPTVVQTNADRDTVIGLVALRRSITLLYASNAGVIHPGVIYREISAHSRARQLPCFACWQSHNDNPALHQFLRLLREGPTIADPEDRRIAVRND
jgi:DNA-binding transcriptional LysR family regulator